MEGWNPQRESFAESLAALESRTKHPLLTDPDTSEDDEPFEMPSVSANQSGSTQRTVPPVPPAAPGDEDGRSVLDGNHPGSSRGRGLPPPPPPRPAAPSPRAGPAPAKEKLPRKLGPLPPPPVLLAGMHPAPSLASLKRRAQDDDSIEIQPATEGSKTKGKGKSGKKAPKPNVAEEKKAARKKPRVSGENQLLKDAKASGAELYKRHSDISQYLSFISKDHPFAGANQGVLAGTRVVLVNPPLGKNARPNEMDVAVPSTLRVLVTHGATVVPPQEFVPAPLQYKRDSPEWVQLALDEQWTTHVVPLEIPNRTLKFSSIPALLGDGSLSAADLGAFVKVVSFQWVSDSIKIGAKAPERPYMLPGDPTVTGEPTRRKPKPPPKQPAKARYVSPESGDEAGEDTVLPNQPPSPFNINDFPEQENPQPGYFDRLERQHQLGKENKESGEDMLANQTTASDPIVDPPLTATSVPRPLKFSGLEEQLDLVKEILQRKFNGDEKKLDEFLENDEREALAESSKDPNMIYSLIEDDYATEEENNPIKKAAAERQRQNGGYACDKSSKGGKPQGGPNDYIARELDLLANLAEVGSFRRRGYAQGAAILRKQPTAIKTYKEAKALRGIGDSLATKLVEIVKTGNHRRNSMTSERQKVLALFQGIYGIGPSIAEEYYNLGCRTLDDLENCRHKSLTAPQKLGLEYYDDLAKRIPRDEVRLLHEYATQAARRIDPKLEVYVMGSYRRGQPDCGDIDLIVTRDTTDGKDHTHLIKKLVTELTKMNVIRHSLSNPDYWGALDAKFNGLCALPKKGSLMRRIDILGVPWDELPAAFIYFTGNEFFNRSMRLKARHLGYHLNQRGLYSNVARDRKGLVLTAGTKLNLQTEQEIFDVLGVTWRPPQERLP